MACNFRPRKGAKNRSKGWDRAQRVSEISFRPLVARAGCRLVGQLSSSLLLLVMAVVAVAAVRSLQKCAADSTCDGAHVLCASPVGEIGIKARGISERARSPIRQNEDGRQIGCAGCLGRGKWAAAEGGACAPDCECGADARHKEPAKVSATPFCLSLRVLMKMRSLHRESRLARVCVDRLCCALRWQCGQFARRSLPSRQRRFD